MANNLITANTVSSSIGRGRLGGGMYVLIFLAEDSQ